MSPLPGTRVIPVGWSRHHAPVAAGGMNAKCRIYDPAQDTTGWDEVTESTTRSRGPAKYDGPCRIQAMHSAGTAMQADESNPNRDYLVQLLFDAPRVAEAWVVVPYDVINDAALNGAELTVVDPQEGSERFTRDLICSHVQD